MSATRELVRVVLVQSEWVRWRFESCSKGDIALSINIQYSNTVVNELDSPVHAPVSLCFSGNVEYHGLKQKHEDMEKRRTSVNDGNHSNVISFFSSDPTEKHNKSIYFSNSLCLFYLSIFFFLVFFDFISSNFVIC